MAIKGMIFIGKNRSFSYFRKLTQHIRLVFKSRSDSLVFGNLCDFSKGFLGSSVVKNSLAMQGDAGSIPGQSSGRRKWLAWELV